MWEQDFNPLAPDAYDADPTPSDSTDVVTIKSFNIYSCNEKTINADSTLDIAYFYEWRNCKSGQTANEAITAANEAAFLADFKGIRQNKDLANPTYPQFPLLETWKDNIFFTFGHDWMYRDYLFPAYYIPNTDEMEYALKVDILRLIDDALL